MAEQHRNIEGIEWTYMDVRNMDSIEDRTVDVAFDKGTLDAMIHGSPWNPPDEVTECTSQYLKEVAPSVAEQSGGCRSNRCSGSPSAKR